MTLALAHVGMTVRSLDATVRWYVDVLGLESFGPPVVVREDRSHAGRVAADVFGAGFGAFRQAHLGSANGTALELFEFRDPRGDAAAAPFPYRRPGLFHLCLVAPQLERTLARIEAHGGRRLTTRVWDIFPEEPYRTCYCEDPFGQIVELYSHSHERTYANRSAV